LAESVSPNDYDWFTPVDLTKVIDAIHALPDWKSVVLVGGQSLTAWVESVRQSFAPKRAADFSAERDRNCATAA
jgi:hypothetical protein